MSTRDSRYTGRQDKHTKYEMCEGSKGGAKPKLQSSTTVAPSEEHIKCHLTYSTSLEESSSVNQPVHFSTPIRPTQKSVQHCLDSGYLTDSPGVREPVQFCFGEEELSHMGGAQPFLPADDFCDVFELNEDRDSENRTSCEVLQQDQCGEVGVLLCEELDEDVFGEESEGPLGSLASQPCYIPPCHHSSVGLLPHSPSFGQSLFCSVTPPRPLGPYLPHRFSTGCMPSYGARIQESPSRSTATTTPSQHNLMVKEDLSTQRHDQPDSVHQRFLVQTSVMERLRSQSVGNGAGLRTSQGLPCLAPHKPPNMRDRSCSEPSVRSSLERYFGEELRRISDEFHQSYESLSREEVLEAAGDCLRYSASFPQPTIQSASWWNRIHHFLSSQPNRHCWAQVPHHPQTLWQPDHRQSRDLLEHPEFS